MRSCCPRVPLHAHVRHVLWRALFRYGRLVGSHPWLFILLPFLALGGLGAGVIRMEETDALEDIHMPQNSRAVLDQAEVRRLFPDRTGDHYDALELNEDQIMGSIIFRARNNASVYDQDVITEIRDVIAKVKDNVTAVSKIKVEGGRGSYTLSKYEDICGRRQTVCVVTGERLLAPQFDTMRTMGILTYPKWKLPTTGDVVDLSFALADSDSELKRVGVVRVTFKLRHDLQPQAFAWEDAFVTFMRSVTTNRTDIVFSASSSIGKETSSGFHDDIFFVWASLGLVAFCACLVTWGGDFVSTRSLLVPIGVASPALGTLGSMGLLSLCGVKVVEMVWVVPLLVVGVGTTDMSLLMASWSSRLGRKEGEGGERKEGGEEEEGEEDVPQRVGWCVAEVGPAITVSSLSLSLTFCAAYTSPFPSVAHFCLYAGVAVLLSYLSTMTLGVASLALHAHRVIAARHVITCHVTSSRDQLRKEGRSLCSAVLCGGAMPDKSYGDQSVLEKAPRIMLVRLTRSMVGKLVVIILFLAVLSASVYGVVRMKHGVELKTLVSQSSYTSDYLNMDADYFGFSFPVIFVLEEGVEYNKDTADRMGQLLNQARQDPYIEDDFVRCWLNNFVQSSFYNRTTGVGENVNSSVTAHQGENVNSSSMAHQNDNGNSSFTAQTQSENANSSFTAQSRGENFPMDVVEDFLLDTEMFLGDVVLDENGERVVASRCYVFSKKNSNQDELTRLMQRMRNLAAGAGVKVFAFHPAFLNYDQRLAILPEVFRTTGIAIAVLLVVFLLFFPEILGVMVVAATALSVLLGMVGFMAFLSVSLSFVSLTHVVYNAGFAVYFSVHVAAAYLQSDCAARADRVSDAVARAAAPLLNGAVCIGVGAMLLLPAASFSFLVLAKITLLTLAMVFFHAVFFAPVILSLIGCEKSQEEVDKDRSVKAALKRVVKIQTSLPSTKADSRPATPRSEENGGSRGKKTPTPPQTRNGHGPKSGQNWPHYFTSPPASATSVHVISRSNGRSAQRHPKEKNGKHSLRSTVLPLPDYENSSVKGLRHQGLASLTFVGGHTALPNAGYCNTTPGVKAASNPYHHWPSLNSTKRSENVYDVPFAAATQLSCRNALSGGEQSQPVVSTGRQWLSSPNAVKRIMDNRKEPKSPRQSRSREEEPSADIVASLDNMDDGLDSNQGDSVASLEGIHHVACTLSTNGVLGATQAYVIENFRDRDVQC